MRDEKKPTPQNRLRAEREQRGAEPNGRCKPYAGRDIAKLKSRLVAGFSMIQENLLSADCHPVSLGITWA